MLSLPAHMIYISREYNIESEIMFEIAKFKHTSDYCANKSVEVLGENSFTFTDKPVWLISTMPDGQVVVDPISKVSDVVGGRIGPTYMIARSDDTKYFSIREQEYAPIQTEEVTVEDGNSFYTEPYIGWACCVISGSINNMSQGSIFLITETKHLIVTNRTKIVLVKKV